MQHMDSLSSTSLILTAWSTLSKVCPEYQPSSNEAPSFYFKAPAGLHALGNRLTPSPTPTALTHGSMACCHHSACLATSQLIIIFFLLIKKFYLKKRKAPLSIQEVYTRTTKVAYKKKKKEPNKPSKTKNPQKAFPATAREPSFSYGKWMHLHHRS